MYVHGNYCGISPLIYKSNKNRTTVHIVSSVLKTAERSVIKAALK